MQNQQLVFLHEQLCKSFSFVVAEFHFKDVETEISTTVPTCPHAKQVRMDLSSLIFHWKKQAILILILNAGRVDGDELSPSYRDLPLIQMLAPTSPNERMEIHCT